MFVSGAKYVVPARILAQTVYVMVLSVDILHPMAVWLKTRGGIHGLFDERHH